MTYMQDNIKHVVHLMNVITNVNNKLQPQLKPHSCSAGATGIVKGRELIRAMTKTIAGITGLKEAEVTDKGMVEEVFNTCQTDEELKAHFDTLEKRYGKLEEVEEDTVGGSESA
ncbi:MAG TPA: hypothetical protein VF717_19735 [Pyrinomonadaceae bacterium]|jgi:hypothetical protein